MCCTIIVESWTNDGLAWENGPSWIDEKMLAWVMMENSKTYDDDDDDGDEGSKA